MMRFALFGLVFSLALSTCAQNISFEPDWIPEAVGDKNWKPLIGFDSRRSFYDDRNVKFLGLRLGAQHRGVHRFGLGFYRMTRGETYSGILVDRPDASADAQVRYQAGFVTLFYERVVMQAGRLELATPVYLGAGNVEGTYKDVTGVFRPYLDESFSVFGFGLMAKYRLLPWLEPGVGGGMRFVYNAGPDVQSTLQSPYYAFKISILLGELYHHVVRMNKD